ncbi:MAG: type IV pilus modification protein PilV [Chromatiales bacterium]|jgi:type IV pilus assembly protein PilV
MKVTRQPIKQHSNRGITLIEVLVTIIILSVGLLGLAGMHFHGLKNNQSSYFRSQATILAYSAFDAMRANREDALNEDYDIAIGTAASADGTVAKEDLVSWKAAMQAALPSGDGSIDCTTLTSLCVVVVQWDDSVGEGGLDTQQFTVTTEL